MSDFVGHIGVKVVSSGQTLTCDVCACPFFPKATGINVTVFSLTYIQKEVFFFLKGQLQITISLSKICYLLLFVTVCI